jgi:hypothetical protein
VRISVLLLLHKILVVSSHLSAGPLIRRTVPEQHSVCSVYELRYFNIEDAEEEEDDE